MEGYARHSRFHSRGAPPPGEAVSCKKGYGNGGTIGGNGFMAYDDVFGGAPKFGATAPFAPRAEDYSEIFGSFRSGRASSIPMLDLPPVDDSVAAFDAVGCSGFAYHEIFGSFGFADFAVSYDELFRRSDGSEVSSDDAWTPVGSQSLSGESDPSACSGRNQYFLNDGSHQTLGNKFSVPYREDNLETTGTPDCKHGTQLSDVPGYSHVVEGPSSHMQDGERHSSGVADDTVLCEDTSGNISVETKSKTTDLPSPPRVSTKVVDRERDSLRSASSYEHRNVNAAETVADCSSFDFFDVEIDAAGSSALSSEAAVKEAMGRSKVKMGKAKDLVEKKVDMNGHEMVGIVSYESTPRDDDLQSTYRSKSDLFKTSEKAVEYASEASQGLPDCLQVENGVSGAAKPSLRRNIKERSPVQEPGITAEAGDWKVAAQYYELVNDCNPKIEPTLLDNAKKFAQMDDYYLGNARAKTMSRKQPKQDAGVNTCAEENGDAKSAREACDPRKTRRRPRATKAASRQNFHERMVGVAQVVDEAVAFGLVELKEANEGFERDGADSADSNLKGSDQSAQQIHHERKHREEFELAESELRSKEDVVETCSNKKEIGTCGLEEREVHGVGVNDADQIEEKEEACTRKETEARNRVVSPLVNGNPAVLDAPLENGEDAEKSGRGKKQNSDLQLKKSDGECWEREDEIWGKEAIEMKVKEAQKTDQCGESVDQSIMADCCESNAKGSVGPEKADEKLKGSDGTSNKERGVEITEKEDTVNTIQASEFERHQKTYEDSAANGEQEMDHKGDMQSELKSNEKNSYHGTHLHVELEFTSSIGSCAPGETNDKVFEVISEPEELNCLNLAATPDEKHIKPTTAEFECIMKPESYTADDTCVGETESEAVEDICVSPKHLQKTEAAPSALLVRKENPQKQSVSSNLNHRFEEDGKADDGNLAAEGKVEAENSKRGDEAERNRLRELELERERNEKEQIRKHEEERERERVKELEKLRLRRLEELREREREKELGKFRLRNLEEERQREREKDLEIERQRKLEEEWERQREREKDRMGMELKTSVAREKAEKLTAEREAVESRQRAMAEARERLEKACAEARGKSFSERASAEARLRAERAAVERAAAEARERALGKAMAERATFEGRERVERSVSDKFSSTFRDERLRHCSSSSDLWNSDKSYGVEGESAQRSKARMERHRRTVERVAKALAEKNTRDLIAQREQAERSRLAETLDGDIKRWSNGKEGNLRALLSTLQYILGPDGGWQPIPLTEVITSAAVKKAYRRATLCVHPDKLQQRGATIQQKYICEKVFDLLKEAWNKFNSEER